MVLVEMLEHPFWGDMVGQADPILLDSKPNTLS